MFKHFLSQFSQFSHKQNIHRQVNQNGNRKTNKNDRSNVLFFFALFIVAITVVSCCGVITNPQSKPDVVKSAFTLNTAIVSSLVGFITGKAMAE